MTKSRRILAALLAVLCLLTLAPGAYAVTQADIDALKNNKKALTTEKKAIEDQLSQLKNDKANAIQRRTLLDQQIAVTEQEIQNTEDQISGYEALLVQTAYELAENERQEEEQYALFCERARVMEKSGSTSYWSVLFKAANFSDLLSRLADIQEVMNYDQDVLDTLRRLRAQIEEKKAYQEELKTGAEAAKVELESKKAELSVQRKAADDLVAELQADQEAAEMLLKEREAEESRIQAEIKKKENELAEQIRKEKELAAQMAAAQLVWDSSTTGGYIWPVSTSKKITSSMGARNTGIKGASTNHKGTDIGGVGTTSSVYATKAGVVITSAYSRSYGNYVVIRHGTGNTTLYAHMSKRSVSEGDVVSQGQVIGVTGSTGISSGPHLHYEVTEGGVRVNPLTKGYLPGYYT